MFSSLSSKSLPHLTFLSHLFQWLSLLINYLTKCIAISATFTTRVQNAAVFQTLRDDQITVIIPGKQNIHIHIFFPLGTRRCGTTKSYKFFLPSFLLPSLPPSFLFFLASFSQFQFRCLIAPTKLQAPWRLGLLSALFTIGTKTNKPSKILGADIEIQLDFLRLIISLLTQCLYSQPSISADSSNGRLQIFGGKKVALLLMCTV